MELTECPYRAIPHVCKLQKDNRTVGGCERCLMGQLIDSTELQAGAIMALIESKE